ncbi:hypothetical protein DPMN_025028 [Dreissena polymorpha]|uniref:Uncharacterized protein n=1 Tax=Dreissena polymorpha TaxID=45954 RepID=A0A9D4LQH9_DREPO|nr:hypothetical protein DPMN_025028 [Dreissena polymorpha]
MISRRADQIWTKPVTSRFHEDLSINVSNIAKTAPPLTAMFSNKPEEFSNSSEKSLEQIALKLVTSKTMKISPPLAAMLTIHNHAVNKSNALTSFHKDWISNVTCVFTRNMHSPHTAMFLTIHNHFRTQPRCFDSTFHEEWAINMTCGRPTELIDNNNITNEGSRDQSHECDSRVSNNELIVDDSHRILGDNNSSP